MSRLNETGQYFGKYYVLCANMSSTETTLNDVPSMTSRLQSLRLTTHGDRETAAAAAADDEDDDDATENVTAAGGSAAGRDNIGDSGSNSGASSSRESLRNMQPIGNVTLSRARRALNFVCDEDQPTSSSAARSDTSFSNGDK